MELLLALLIVIMVIIFFKIRKLVTIQTKSAEALWVIAACSDSMEQITKQNAESNREITYDLQTSIEAIDEKIHNINYVMDIIYKYKLPNPTPKEIMDAAKVNDN